MDRFHLGRQLHEMKISVLECRDIRPSFSNRRIGVSMFASRACNDDGVRNDTDGSARSSKNRIPPYSSPGSELRTATVEKSGANGVGMASFTRGACEFSFRPPPSDVTDEKDPESDEYLEVEIVVFRVMPPSATTPSNGSRCDGRSDTGNTAFLRKLDPEHCVGYASFRVSMDTMSSSSERWGSEPSWYPLRKNGGRGESFPISASGDSGTGNDTNGSILIQVSYEPMIPATIRILPDTPSSGVSKIRDTPQHRQPPAVRLSPLQQTAPSNLEQSRKFLKSCYGLAHTGLVVCGFLFVASLCLPRQHHSKVSETADRLFRENRDAARRWGERATDAAIFRRVRAAWTAGTAPAHAGERKSDHIPAAIFSDVSEAVLSRTAPPSAEEKLESRRRAGRGRALLRSNGARAAADPAGAKTACASATLLDPDSVDAWTCLGESGLALHAATVTAGRGDGRSRVDSARESFEMATAINPTNARARAGLGTSLLLLGTSASPQTPTTQALDASLHLSSAISLLPSKQSNETSTKQDSVFQITLYYNTALSFISVGDYDRASMFLERTLVKLSPLLEQPAPIPLSPSDDDPEERDDAPQDDGPEDSTDDLRTLRFVAKMNLGGCHLKRGNWTEAIRILKEVGAERCGIEGDATALEEGEADDIEDAEATSGEETTVSGTDASTRRLCDIVSNNAELALELLERDGISDDEGDESVVSAVSDVERIPDLSHGEVVAPAIETVAVDQNVNDEDDTVPVVEDDTVPEILTEKDQHVNDEDEEDTVPETVTEKDPPPEKRDDVPPELRIALDTLERAVSLDPDRARLWLGLSKTRARANDFAGAVEAAANAVSVSSDNDEMDLATAALEAALDRVVAGSSLEKVSSPSKKEAGERSRGTDRIDYQDSWRRERHGRMSATSTTDEVTSLRYEVEIQSLKLELLRRDLGSGDTGRTGGDSYQRGRDTRREDDGAYDPTPASELRRSGEEPPLRKEEAPIVKEDIIITNPITVTEVVELPTEVDTPEQILVEPEVVSTIQTPSLEDNDVTEISLKDEINHDNVNDGNDVLESTEVSTEATEDILTEATVDIPTKTTAEIDKSKEAEPVPDEPKEEIPKVPQLPVLYNPIRKDPVPLEALSKSHMKIADAYLDKQEYRLASKQFAKVLKKAPDHLPALLGRATALEREGKPKTAPTIALLYGNATQVAVAQGDGGGADTAGLKKGEGGMAERILQRAIMIVEGGDKGDRVGLLRELSRCAHTASLAADIYYRIGSEIWKDGKGDKKEAAEAFESADLLIQTYVGEESFHGPSLIGLGKLIVADDGDTTLGLAYFTMALRGDLDVAERADAMLSSGRAKKSLGDTAGSIASYEEALTLPETAFTAQIHHYLALALSDRGDDSAIIKSHLEQALDLGMEPTAEALAVLGKDNYSVITSTNKQIWDQYQHQENSQGGGGILSGAPVGSSNTAFNFNKDKGGDAVDNGLNMIEQGAAAYDGSVPTGSENDDSSLKSVGRKRNVV